MLTGNNYPLRESHLCNLKSQATEGNKFTLARESARDVKSLISKRPCERVTVCSLELN